MGEGKALGLGKGKMLRDHGGDGGDRHPDEGNRGEMLPDHNAPRGNALGLGCSRKCDGAGAQ